MSGEEYKELVAREAAICELAATFNVHPNDLLDPEHCFDELEEREPGKFYIPRVRIPESMKGRTVMM
jgi:hypothetical protein